ncbi:MAG: hypothetical protein QOJ03_478 [Frankiaceae bacterium]|nr:hypothetical protein [Frankiaceae bacterium]
MRSSRLLLATVVLGTVAAGGVGASVGAAKQGKCTSTFAKAGDNWLAATPPFSEGPKKVTQVVAPSFVPDRLLATNGVEVLRSENAGCTWTPIVIPEDGSLGVLPEPVNGLFRLPANSTVADIAAPSSGNATDAVYIAFNTKTALETRPHVVHYTGKGFEEGEGLPRSGTVRQLSAVDTSAATVYAVVDPSSAIGDGGIYASLDGGRKFAQQNSSAQSSDVGNLTSDPFVNTSLYAQNGSGVIRTVDGGKHFGPLGGGASDVTTFDVASDSGDVNFAIGHSRSRTFDWSPDGGLSFHRAAAPVVPTDITIQPVLAQFAMSDDASVWLQKPTPICHGTRLGTMFVKDVSPTVGGLTQLQMSAPLANGFAVVGLSDQGALVRGTFSLCSEAQALKGRTPVELLRQVQPHHFPSTLTPGHTTLAIPAGGHRDVTYHLLVPRTPSPIDVMLLVDTTQSEDKTIDGLRQDLATIVNDLGTIGLDVQFGLADFRDYSPTVADMGDGDIGDYPYMLRRRIGPVDASLHHALSQLRAVGGGDAAESDLTALYQSTTGAGQTYGRKTVIKPGLDAGYRSDSLRLAVLATDNVFHRESDYLTPTWGETVAAMKDRLIYPIGLAVQTIDDKGKPQGFRSFRDQSELGLATGALAPRGGVDCDGNLVVDIKAGDPIVCPVPLHKSSGVSVGGIQIKPSSSSLHLAPVITTTAASIPDMRTVGLQFAGAHGIASVVRPTAFPQINLKSDNTIDYTVRYTCPRVHKRHVYGFDVNATDGHRVLTSSAAQVACGGVPVAVHHPLIPPETVAAVVPPAAAVVQAQPGNPIPNPNPNPNPALNANVGFASQEEEQRQLAFAGAETGIDEEASTELAMSRLGGGAALLLAAATGYAARRRFAAAWHRR